MIKAEELRRKFLSFFEEKGHKAVSSASLIPENDPTVLFTTAGMHPLVPYLMGEKHPEGTRLTSVQKCIRTGDIDEVGDNFHLTFFEMLGNWSLGDYFKEEAIKFSWEFLTDEKWLGLDKNRLAVSVFAGDENAPFDEEAFGIWRGLGVAEERIAKLPKKNNWWGPAGETGPCGPDSEMFYWTGEGSAPDSFDADDESWVEIWNDVFMQYYKNAAGRYEPLKQKNVDTGMGLERTLAVLNGLDDVYRTELLWPVIEKIENLSGKKYGGSDETARAMRIVADHLKAAVMILGDERGISPSNTDQGYVLRRLIRRAINYARQLEIKNDFTAELARMVIEMMAPAYGEIARNQDFILEELRKEEEKFGVTLTKAWPILKKAIEDAKNKGEKIPGDIAFDLYQSYGMPWQLQAEEAKKQGVALDTDDFNSRLSEHVEKSRTASAGMFKGGLADDSEMAAKYHSATHLLQAALRRVLGEQVAQKGSNINSERMRFDFTHGEKMTPEQIERVENIVNEQIAEDWPIVCAEMTLDEAKASGATGLFEHKYGERVKVYTIGPEEGAGPFFSKEICGGPHASRTGELGHFRILKEESSSAGVRRIKAVLE